MRRHVHPGLLILAAVLLGACAAVPVPASPLPATARPTSSAVAPTPVPTPARSAVSTRGPSPSGVAGIGILQCDGSETSMTIDWAADARGTDTDLVAATRRLSGIRPSDVISAEGSQTAVNRDGLAIWIGNWFAATGGWLLSGFTACGNAGIATKGS